ncbi:MAG TPA: carbohydrate ABC transporter permease [Anaerolineales bacterium]|nr:carbohydrate ABC transporter permease [Anaerolineales bacterium]
MLKSIFRRKSLSEPSPGETILIYIVLLIWTAVVLFPIYWLFVTSFKLPIDVNTGPFYIPFVDFKPSLHAWDYILAGDLANDTRRNFLNTLIVAPVSAGLALFLGTAAAYALIRFEYRPRLGAILSFIGCLALAIFAITLGAPWQISLAAMLVLFVIILQTIGKRFKRALGNNDIAFWLISQRMLPPVAVVIPIYILFQRMALLDTRTALIITYIAVNLPIVVWLMRDYFQTIPIELEECAAIDGASRYRIFQSIVIPLAVPGLVATFLFVLVFAWNEYLLALFLSGAKSQTLPLTIAAQNATRGPQWWYMSVLIMIMIVPVIIMAIALERYIARGLLVGAVKG